MQHILFFILNSHDYDYSDFSIKDIYIHHCIFNLYNFKKIPAYKHSQYFFQHLLFLHVQNIFFDSDFLFDLKIFSQSKQLHLLQQGYPAQKHSQYYFWHLLFLQLQLIFFKGISSFFLVSKVVLQLLFFKGFF